MELDPRHILDLVGLDTILAAFAAGALASFLYLRSRRAPTSLGLIGGTADER